VTFLRREAVVGGCTSAWTAAGLIGAQLLGLRGTHDLRVVLRHLCDLLLHRGRLTGLAFVMLVNTTERIARRAPPANTRTAMLSRVFDADLIANALSA
jgi:hypothetical protein